MVVLDAFFLGKPVAEALTERIESSIGEYLSTVGRLQAEQHKQREFMLQKEVLERANKTKETATREAMDEQQGILPTSQESYTMTVASDPSPMVTLNGPMSIQGDEATDGDPLSEVATQE